MQNRPARVPATRGADGLCVVGNPHRSGNADFPFYFADLHAYICPSKDGAIDWQSGVGAGAYVLDGFEPGTRISVKKNPNDYRSDRG